MILPRWSVLAVSPLLLGTAPVAAVEVGDAVEEVIVSAKMYRSRETTVPPLLSYDLDFFQQLEPISVGDMLKRVPGVAFTSDIGEYDAPQLRGLATQYTQVLINGRRIPGAGQDRSVFVDRIPAELVDHIEIIRSPTPDLDAQGIAGTLDIVLKDGATLEGVDLRATGYRYTEEKEEWQGAGAASVGGRFDGGSYFLLGNVQERYAPKGKETEFRDDEGARDGSEQQDDTRDSTDKSFTANVSFGEGNNVVGFEGSYLETERDEDELSTSFDSDGVLDEREFQHEDIAQKSSWVQAFMTHELGGGMLLDADLSYSRFDEDTDNTEGVVDEGAEIAEGLERIRTDDDETKAGITLTGDLGDTHRVAVGIDAQTKARNASQRVFEIEDDAVTEETPGSGVYDVEENRLDAFAMDTWSIGDRVRAQYGVRGENTQRDLDGSDGSDSTDSFDLNPSAHVVFQVTEGDQFRASVARTVRRPSFDQLVPFTDEDTPADDLTTIGNPDLDDEISVGADVGYEHRFLDQNGIFGLNFFYRDIKDVIELVEIGTDLFTPDNVDDGSAWGAELDMSMPLDFLGVPSVAFYANATWLDSAIDDPLTGDERRFNLQPDYVYNIGFFHELTMWDFTYGASFQKQGEADLAEADAVRTIEYDGNLEVFAEKRFGGEVTARFVATNLLDAQKIESITNYDSLTDRLAGAVDSSERETEETGPVFSLTLRVGL